VGWLGLWAALLFGVPALGLEPPRAVVISSGHPELGRKLHAEALQAGLAVETTVEPSTTSDAEVARLHRAIVVFRVVSPERVRVHIGESSEREVYETQLERTAADGEFFATRVVELVRGRLVELRLLPASEPTPASGSGAAPDHVASPPATAGAGITAAPAGERAPSDRGVGGPAADHSLAPMIWLSAGAAGTIASGGLGPTLQAGLGLRVEPSERWSIAALALLPLSVNEVAEPEGEAEVRVDLLVGEVGYSLLVDRRFRLEIGPGAGIVMLPMAGEAAAPLEGHDEQIVSGVFFARGGGSFVVAPWFALRVSLRAGLSAPRPVVRFDSREVAAWGHGFGLAMLEGSFGWPLASSDGAR